MRHSSKVRSMKQALRETLIAMARRDLQVRQDLASDGSLFEGYHPQMQAVHETNAAALASIIDDHGWPASDVAGDDGAEAAWLIVQHAIGLPAFQRRCLMLLQAAAEAVTVPAWQPAMLLDRICIYEGKPQVYGTSFDWDEHGEMSPRPIDDPDKVDDRRAAIGLGSLAEATERQRKQTAEEPRPINLTTRQHEFEEWAKRVGWR